MKRHALLGLMVAVAGLGVGELPALARPNAALVRAIKNSLPIKLDRELSDRTRYYFSEVDLNNDRKKETVVYVYGAFCGMWECPVYIFTKTGSTYRLIGKTAAMTGDTGARVAVLSSKTNGWLDIATLVYDPHTTQTANWKLHRFNERSYQNSSQNLSETPRRIILRNSGSGLKLD